MNQAFHGMRPLSQSVTTLLLSLLVCVSCGPELERADALLEKGEFQQVVELLSDDSQPGPPSPEVTVRLAKAYWGLDEVPKAVRICRDTLAAHPQATLVSRILAEMYLSLAQYPRAVETLREARANGAGDEVIALTLGVSLGRMKDLEGAREELARAARAGAPQTDVDYNMAVILGQEEQHAEAEGLLKKVLAADPDHFDAERELARILLCAGMDDAGRLEEAVRSLNAVLDARPQDWRANELMGDAYMAYGDPEAAVFYYTDALKYGRNPEHVEGKYRAAAQARNDLLREQGVLEEKSRPRGSPPPIPDSLRERWDRARRERAEQAGEAGGTEQPTAAEGDPNGG